MLLPVDQRNTKERQIIRFIHCFYVNFSVFICVFIYIQELIQCTQYSDWATGWTYKGSWFDSWQVKDICNSLYVQPDSGAHPASHSVGNRALYMGVKQLGCQTDHSPQSNAKVKNGWSCASIPLYDFMACTRTTLPVPLFIYIYDTVYNMLIAISYTDVQRDNISRTVERIFFLRYLIVICVNSRFCKLVISQTTVSVHKNFMTVVTIYEEVQS